MIFSPCFDHRRRQFAALAVASVGLAACGGSYGGGAREAPSPTAASGRFSYGPFSQQYEVVSYTNQDRGPMGGSSSVIQYYLTATAAQAGGAARLQLTIDSIPRLEGPMVDRSDVAAATGATFSGILSPDGEIVSFQGGTPQNALLTQLADGLSRFFPTIPDDGVTPGAVWHDTTTILTGDQGVEIEVVAAIRYEADEWGEHDGVRALLVHRSSNYTLTGGGNAGGADFTIDGSGVEHGQLFLGSDGSYLGGASADTANMTATVPAAGMSVPIVQTQADTVRVVR